MSVATFHRVLTVAAVAASLASAAYLLGARADETALSDARTAVQRGDGFGAARELRDVGTGATVEGRAAAVAAQAAFLRGDRRVATDRLREAVRARPNDWRVRRDLAVALAVQGNVDGAREQAERTLELNPRATLPSGFNVRVGRD